MENLGKQVCRCIIGACDETCEHYDVGKSCCVGYAEVAEQAGKAFSEYENYKNLEKKGKLPLLHIGDTIYFIVFGHNEATGKYEDYIQHETITSVFITKGLLTYTTESKGFASSEIGKSVFATEKEAEVVLNQRN